MNISQWKNGDRTFFLSRSTIGFCYHTVAMQYLMLAVNKFSLSASPIGGAMALEPEKSKPDFQVTIPLFTLKFLVLTIDIL